MHADGSRLSDTQALDRPEAEPQQTTVHWPAAIPNLGRSTERVDQNPALEMPDYLVKHYWWAYLWRPAVWFFDHQPIINTIVFGQYRKLTEQITRLVGGSNAGDTLMIASAYGYMIPKLAISLNGPPLTVIDVAPIQLERARAKLEAVGLADRVTLRRMNAEKLAFADDSRDTSMFFLLLHELPPEPRRRAVSEALRVTRPGGHLVLAEYGEMTRSHWFHRFAPLRWILGTAEPFLPSLWQLDLDALLAREAARLGKRIVREERVSVFGGFYRALRYRIEQV